MPSVGSVTLLAAAVAAVVCGIAGGHDDVDALLPDFDCITNPIADDVADSIKDFLFALIAGNATSAGCTWAGECESEMSEPTVWKNHLHKLVFAGHAGKADQSWEVTESKTLLQECPFALLALRVAQWGACLMVQLSSGSGMPEDAAPFCTSLSVWLIEHWDGWPFGIHWGAELLTILLNTRWASLVCALHPYLQEQARSHAETLDPAGNVPRTFDCSMPEYDENDSGITWPEYLKVLAGQARNENGEKRTTHHWISAGDLLYHYQKKFGECGLGYLTMLLERLRIHQKGRTDLYDSVANTLALVWANVDNFVAYYTSAWPKRAQGNDALTVLLLSKWPVLPFFCALSHQSQDRKLDGSHGYQYKPYELDFLPEEILGTGSEAQQRLLSPSASRDDRRNFVRTRRTGRVSETYRGVLRAAHVNLAHAAAQADGGGEGWAGRDVMMVTVVWGDRLAGYLPGVLGRAAAFGHGARYLVFCLDEASHARCFDVHPHVELCVRGQLKTIFNKHTMVATLLHLGFHVVYLDFDTIMFRDPLPPILEAAAEAEVLVGRDFGGQCLNVGVMYFKPHLDTSLFLRSLLSWLWHHPYEFDQQAFAAFLGHENVTTEELWGSPLEKIPRWRILDPTNAFVSSIVYHPGVEGWTGNMEDIVVYHFLDGTGGVDPETAVAGEYVNRFDLFYANPRLNLSDAGNYLWVQDPRVRAELMSSRLPGPPGEALIPCGTVY